MLAHARPCLLAPANVYECFHMLANACDSYDHLSALPVQMLRQVPNNMPFVREVINFWLPYSCQKYVAKIQMF